MCSSGAEETKCNRAVMCGVLSILGSVRMKVRHVFRRAVREVAVLGLKVLEARLERSRVRQRRGSEARWYHCVMG